MGSGEAREGQKGRGAEDGEGGGDDGHEEWRKETETTKT